MLKLSIIVPVYKVESYLHKCVDSLLMQDLSRDLYEIILVDDGSPDKCPFICDEYAERFDNVYVIHQDNGGLSAARNSGIAVARGEYVQFVDSDDYLEPDVLKSLVDYMDEGRFDVLRFNYQNVNERYEKYTPKASGRQFMDYREEPCDGITFLTERLGFACYAVQFIIRRSLLEGCLFRPGIFFEDTEWTPRLLLRANRVSSTGLIAYNYVIRQGSITKSIEMPQKRKVLKDMLQAIDFLHQTSKAVQDKRWFDGMISVTVLSIVKYVVQNRCIEWTSVKESLKEKDVFPLSFYHASRSNRRKIRMANLSPSFLYYHYWIREFVLHR